ncbi:MAG: transcriptional regulator, TraR/DksA family [Pedosphaera sp.]|nr:transcriptional regulator, TraR/DksA family [Pedosphaera sp.]
MEKKKHKATPRIEARNRAKAATEDIVNVRLAPPKINPKWERHYRHLTELRDFFLRQKGVLTRDANEEQPTYSEHMADAGTDSYDRDFALSMLSSDQNALYEIEEALRRIEAGTYGICELTGKPIPVQRLNAIPWARFRIEAEKQLEQTGVVNRARLGTLGSLAGGETATEEEETPEPESHENNS